MILSVVIIGGLVFFFMPQLENSLIKGRVFSLEHSTNENLRQNSSNKEIGTVQSDMNQNDSKKITVQNPISVGFELIGYCDNFTQTKNATDLGYLKNSANWLVANSNYNGNYSLYEYGLPPENGLTPTRSALAQGIALQGLGEAFALTGNYTYLDTSKSLLKSFDVDVRDGGITENPASNGLWYEAYVTSGNENSHDLTGMMYVLLALHDYYKLTKNAKAEYFFNQGVDALKANISNYDGNTGSYNDALSSDPTTPAVRQTQVRLLARLYAITGDSIFQEYAAKWKSYGNSVGNQSPLPVNDLNTLQPSKIKIAIIKNTFTGGAYNDAFYKFYAKYYFWKFGANVTSHVTYPGFGLDLLTGTIPDYDIGGYNTWYIQFMKRHLESVFPSSSVDVLTDQDVNNGLLFNGDGSNAYALIILGHQEYVTGQEYENLKSFVSNGGRIVFLDGNVFYAEVQYDKDKNSVTLVKGHGWEFDGKSARKSTLERWFDETSDWVGGNYWPRGNEQIYFANNVFGYTNDEETFANNPKDKIILDYGAERKDIFNNKAVADDELAYGMNFKVFLEPKNIATYELDYGKGNVINLGLYAENLFGKPKFNSFFDNLVSGLLSGHPSTFNYVIPH